jgi:hypothetical protein
MLRRAIPSFTVEVRRRPRLATTSNPDVQSSETKSAPAAFDRASQRPAVAAFAAQDADPSSVDVMASHRRGRILPSLVSNERWHPLLEDAAVPATDSEPRSRAQKRPSERARKRADRASKSPRNSTFSPEENAGLAERPSTKSQRTSRMQSNDGAGATLRDPTRAPSQVVDDSQGLTLTANRGKRTIMARYVFGNEDKPGERWKRRLLRSR